MTTIQFDELVDEILDEKNDRSLIILCSSIIDEQLFEILKSYLITPIKKDDDLLKGDSPLSTFSSRIKMIYRIGIIDSSFKDILENVRKIRNQSAHNVQFSFSTPPIKDHLLTLKKSLTGRQSYISTKDRFLKNNLTSTNEVKLLFITICVILEAINNSITKVNLNTKTISISKK